MNKITIYGQIGCGWCDKAKALCDRKGYAYDYVDLSYDPELRAKVEAKTGLTYVPQVFVGEKHIGGFKELAEADQNNSLQQIIGGQ